MRTVGAGNSAQPTGTLTDFTDKVKVEVANASDVLVDLTAYGVSVEYDSSADEIMDAATVVFRRLEGASSLAPLMTVSPPVALGRRIVVSVNPGAGLKEVFRGKITDVDWPERDGDVTVQCLDQARDASRTWIETPREYGSTAGVSLETVMQAVANDNLAAPVPVIYFPAATGAVVQHVSGDAPYGPTEQSVLDAERVLAESYGGTIRWRYIDSLSAWRWTVFTPSRTKTTPDHTFGTSDYFDVKQIKLADADIRNVIEVSYIGAGGVAASVTVSDTASIAAYGRLYAKISEGSDSPVNNSTLATSMANAALSDLKEPDVLMEIACRYFWPGEIGVDLYRFTANNKHFSSDQDLAPMQFRHRIAVGESPTTHMLVRGQPSGGVLSWRRKGATAGGTTAAPPATGTPAITSATLSEPSDNLLRLVVSLNASTVLWRAWARRDGSPLTAGVPVDEYLRYNGPTPPTQVEWKAEGDGGATSTWTAVVRAYNSAGEYVEATRTQLVGGTFAPSETPTSPFVESVTAGFADAYWTNTSATDTMRIEWSESATSGGAYTVVATVNLAAATTTHTRAFTTGKWVKARVRYYNAIGDGPWSNISIAKQVI